MTTLEKAARAIYELYPLTSGTGMPRKPDGAPYTWDEVVERDHHLARQSRERATAALSSALLDPSDEDIKYIATQLAICAVASASEGDQLFIDMAHTALRAAGVKINE